jgi:hypothetical protein
MAVFSGPDSRKKIPQRQITLTSSQVGRNSGALKPRWSLAAN